MGVNLDKPQLWKADVARSVDMYNDWFLKFAPETYRQTRIQTTSAVEEMLKRTDNLRNVNPQVLSETPCVLTALRMCCAPPIARDRLVGLAQVSKTLVLRMELQKTLPPRMDSDSIEADLRKIGNLIERLADRDIFPWLEQGGSPKGTDRHRAATIVADRLCGAETDPILRNAQERRQLACLKRWLEARGYTAASGQVSELKPGTFATRMVVQGRKEDGSSVNIPIDCAVMPLRARPRQIPLMIEAKSAGDFTNTNKRRKEEATKAVQLRKQHGAQAPFVLFLCGYFDSGYLGYNASERIDWVWEHRMDDLAKFGVQRMTATMHMRESTRLELQARLDRLKSPDERNKLGQFATPPDLALQVVRYAISLVEDSAKIRFLDPAFGTGSFYGALLNSISRLQLEKADGFEIDPHYGAPAASLWAGTGLDLSLVDYRTVEPPLLDAERPNLLICNPPYVRHHHLNIDEKRELQSKSRERSGYSLSGLSGLYCYFLLMSHNWMADGGVAAWLIPSEFMDVNYGKQVKQYLSEKVELIRIHRFDPNDVQFDDALVSSAVVVFRKRHPKKDHQAVFTYGGSLESPRLSMQVSADDLRTEAKWTRFPQQKRRSTKEACTLADLFTIKRGIATGSNEFFILDKIRVEQLELPLEWLSPILPSPRYLEVDEVLPLKNGNPDIERQLFLLSCPLPPFEVEARFPKLWEYLECGVRQGVSNGYICQHRSPWYVQEERQPAPFLCTYMGRQLSGRASPFRFILNASQAKAANVYLLLYPKEQIKRLLANSLEAMRQVREALSSLTAASLLNEGRVYGGGLYKMEPKELARVPADSILAHLGATPKNQRVLFSE